MSKTKLRPFEKRCPEVPTRRIGINACVSCPHCIWVDIGRSEVRCAFRAKAYWF